MKRSEKKIYRKYEDYIVAADLVESQKIEYVNLAIADFNARGEVYNPRVPCVATTIDPDYVRDASRQRLCRKFRMKTDILRLREITRNKFMYYAIEEMYLDKTREKNKQDKMYKEAQEFHEFADKALRKMEADAFREMRATQDELKKLKENKVSDELNQVRLAHQRILMEVQEVYGRFKYLIKLISYFDDTIEDATHSLTMTENILALQINEKNPAGLKEVQQVQEYMDNTVRPYLTKRNHLNADIWLKGYENNRKKISTFNKRFTNLALLNHIVGVLHKKAEKTYEQRIVAPIFLKDPEFMNARMMKLQKRAHELFDNFRNKFVKDKVNIKLNSIVPVILKQIEHKEDKKIEGPESVELPKTSKKSVKQWRTVEDVQQIDTNEDAHYEGEPETTLVKVQKIQEHVLELLGKFDKVKQIELKIIENRVRRQLEREKEMSRRALIKQNRLNNWLEHFKKHHRLLQQQREATKN